MCIFDMYVCLCAYALMYVSYIGILYAKAFSGFSMDLSSSIQLEDVASSIQGEIVGTSKLEAKN